MGPAKCPLLFMNPRLGLNPGWFFLNSSKKFAGSRSTPNILYNSSTNIHKHQAASKKGSLLSSIQGQGCWTKKFNSLSLAIYMDDELPRPSSPINFISDTTVILPFFSLHDLYMHACMHVSVMRSVIFLYLRILND